MSHKAGRNCINFIAIATIILASHSLETFSTGRQTDMSNDQRLTFAIVLLLFGLAACGKTDTPEYFQSQTAAHDEQAADSAVAADILFLVLGKMSLYDQSPTEDISLRNYHFVAEIMPKAGREIISGTLTSASDESQVLEFSSEGIAFLAHGARVQDAAELHQLHPDGDYNFSYETQSGRMAGQTISLNKRATIEQMPMPAAVTLHQNGMVALSTEVDQDIDLTLAWESMPGNTRIATSDLDDLIFVLVFDCFGNNVAHSGRPYQGGPYLTYKDSHYVVPAASLEPGLEYTAIVEQATADATSFQGVPGIATYATLTFVDFHTTGIVQEKSCP